MTVIAAFAEKDGNGADARTVALLQEHAKAVIAPYKYPREIAFVDALPRTSTGKLQRFALKQEQA